MSAPPPFHKLFDINVRGFSKEEICLLEGELFTRLCQALMKNLRSQYHEYFNLIKINSEKEDLMIETSFIRATMNDMLISQEYTLSGIAYYTNTPEEVLYEIATGRNIHPSFALGRKILELHRSIRIDLYRDIIKKIKTELVAEPAIEVVD